MKIYIDRIPSDGLVVEESVSAAELDLMSKDEGVHLSRDVDTHFTVNLALDELIVRGRWETEAEFTCSRCLRTFKQPIVSEDVLYAVEIHKHEIIDLTENIREDIILAFPLRPLCREDCKGLCNVCGAVLDEGECGCDRRHKDPRFDALDMLKNKLKNNN